MAHLTNHCLNRESVKYVNNNDFMTNDNGSKRLLSTLFKQLDTQGCDVDAIKDEIKDICTKIVLALQPFLVNSFHTEMGIGEDGNQNVFHIFGIDLLMDDDLKLWLMEINWFPSFSIYYDKIEIDPLDGTEKETREISELDKYLKSLIMKEAISIVRSNTIPDGSKFEQVFPPKECPEDYKQFTVYNDARVRFWNQTCLFL